MNSRLYLMLVNEQYSLQFTQFSAVVWSADFRSTESVFKIHNKNPTKLNYGVHWSLFYCNLIEDFVQNI